MRRKRLESASVRMFRGIIGTYLLAWAAISWIAVPCGGSHVGHVKFLGILPPPATVTSPNDPNSWWNQPMKAENLKYVGVNVIGQAYDMLEGGHDGQWGVVPPQTGGHQSQGESGYLDSSCATDCGSSDSCGYTVYSPPPGLLAPGSRGREGRMSRGKGRSKERPKFCTFAGGCSKVPYFGDEGGSQSVLFCKQHKQPWHRNVVSKRCEHEGCAKRPVFGHPSFGVVRFCKEHKLENDIDLANRRCMYSGCRKHPVFGETEGTKALYCKQHASTHHVDVRHKKCAHAGCELLPSFGDDKLSSCLPSPQFCNEHKLPGQVSLTRRRPSPKRLPSPSLPPSSLSPSPQDCLWSEAPSEIPLWGKTASFQLCS